MSFKEIKLIENVTAVNLPLWAQQCVADIEHDPVHAAYELLPHDWMDAQDYRIQEVTA